MASDPRVVLRRMESRAKKEFDVDFKVGWEIEFTLYPSIDSNVPIENTRAFFGSSGMRLPSFKVLQQIAEHLEANGVEVWANHTECAPSNSGQMEISLCPVNPMQAADNLVYATEVIQDIAQTNGYFATPHLHALEVNSAINGQHCHMSVSDSTMADNFLSGVLARLRETSAFLLGG